MNQNNFSIDLSLDYHAHILPDCDHGSDKAETSLKQLSMAKAAGIKTVCATPHFYPNAETVTNFLERRQKCHEVLCANLKEPSPQILLGAEVLICDGMDRLDGLEKLCLENTNELLLEMPFFRWSEEIRETLYKLNDITDVQIVLAHADRYPADDIEELIAEGIPLQLNAECLTKPFKRKKYLSWISDGYVKYLGSDIHMLGNGYREFEKSKKLLGKH